MVERRHPSPFACPRGESSGGREMVTLATRSTQTVSWEFKCADSLAEAQSRHYGMGHLALGAFIVRHLVRRYARAAFCGGPRGARGALLDRERPSSAQTRHD